MTQQPTVTFREEDHSYTHNESGKRFTSVTTLIGEFHEHFDTQKVARNYARKMSKMVTDPNWSPEWIKPQYWIDQWAAKNKKATDRGTAFHIRKELEDLALSGKFSSNREGFNYSKALSFIPDGLENELLVNDPYWEVAGQADRVIFDGEWFDIEDFKGLALDTPISTPTGWKTMGEIEVGDTIFDGNGKPTKVKHVSEIHHNPCYKLTFDTNDELVADHEHKWVISIRLADKTHEDMEVTTAEMSSLFQTGEIIRIRNSGSLELPDKDLPIDPYVLGAWLGDGAKACGTITNVQPKFWEEIRARGYDVGRDTSHVDRAESRTVMGLVTSLKKLDLIHNKHLPYQYLTASHKQRLDFLRGLMDTDGHFHPKRNRCVMGTTQYWQAEATMQIVSSLGWKPTLLPVTKRMGEYSTPGWDVCFKALENPFLTRNEDYLDRVKGSWKHCTHRYVKKLELVDMVPTKCLAVESEDHTYLAGKSFIKTHNTNGQLKFRSWCKETPTALSSLGLGEPHREYKKMFFPLNHLEDCNWIHYCLQFSLYAYIIERHSTRKLRAMRLLYHPPLPEDDTQVQEEPIIYEVPYLKEDVELMLQSWAKKPLPMDPLDELVKQAQDLNLGYD